MGRGGVPVARGLKCLARATGARVSSADDVYVLTAPDSQWPWAMTAAKGAPPASMA